MRSLKNALSGRTSGLEEAAKAVHGASEDLPPPAAFEAFGAAFDRFADARVVLLGEATHGSSEFYRARSAITRRLIEKHGFNIVAVEADWPDAARIDRHIRDRPPESSNEPLFARFPSWMWRNTDVAEFVRWLRAFNETRPDAARVEFRGLDIYSLGASIAAVLAYLDRTDPEAARNARRRYGCLTPWQGDPADYGRAVKYGAQDDCEKAAVQQLQELLHSRLGRAKASGEGFFDAAQNARVVQSAEQYYRVMYHGSAESWNLRDRHMFETLGNVLEARGPEAKAVVWAHNSHVGNASATAMGWMGETNIGELCRAGFDGGAVLIGFGTDRGTVAAASDWDGAMEIKNVRPARPDSYEAVFREAGRPRTLTDWRTDGQAALREMLAPKRLERAIGVIYRPESEYLSHYFQAVLPEQFDAYVWFEETSAVTPLGDTGFGGGSLGDGGLGDGGAHGAGDTYPFGL